MTKMEKVKANFREFVQAKTTKASVAASVVLPVLVASVSALEGETASSGDMSTITSAFTTGFQSIVDSGLSMIAAMVPIALLLAGAIFLVKKGMSWFKGVAK